MRPETARRARLLYVALAFLGLDLPPAPRPSGLRALHAWLDTWHGIGLIEMEHSIVQGSGWRMTPWGAVIVGSDSASPARGARNRYFLMSLTVLSIFLPAFSEGPLPISLS